VTGDLPGTSSGGAIIYPPPPISTLLSSSGGGGGGGRQHKTDTPLTGRCSILPSGDVDNGAGEAGEAGDEFSHTEPSP